MLQSHGHSIIKTVIFPEGSDTTSTNNYGFWNFYQQTQDLEKYGVVLVFIFKSLESLLRVIFKNTH